MNYIYKLFVILSIAIITTSCTRDDSTQDDSEYYIKYSASKITTYPVKGSVSYTNEQGKSERLNSGDFFSSGSVTIGPGYKGFTSKLSSSHNISIKIECSKDGGPFAQKAYDRYGGTIEYKIE